MTYTDEQITELIGQADAMREQMGVNYAQRGSILDLWLRSAAALAQVKAERDGARAKEREAWDVANARLDAMTEATRANAALRQVIEDLRGALALDARSSVRVAAAAGILAGEGEQSALTGSSVSSSDEVTEDTE